MNIRSTRRSRSINPLPGRCIALAVLIATGTAAGAADPWKHSTKEEFPGLPGNEIQYIGPAKAGGVWIGTLNGLAQARGGTFKPLQDKTGATLELSVWDILETDGLTWIGHGEGVLGLAGDRRISALTGQTVAPIIQVKPGVLWALAKTRNDVTRLFECRGEEWKPVEAVAERRLTNLYRTNDGRLWLTLHGNGVLEIRPDTGIEKAVHHLEGLNVTALTRDSRGVIWCGLWANGLASWDGTSWQKELPKIKESAVLAIVEDQKANLWVATSANGIWRRPLSKPEWTQDLADQGPVNLLVATSDGRVWISGQGTGGLQYWNGEQWVVSLDSPLPIRTLVETGDGALWAGGVLDGVYGLKK